MTISALSLLMALGVLPAVQGGRKCTNPKGIDGESYTEGCLKMTCKAGVYRTSIDASLCCYNMQPYYPNTTITATEDGCATAVIYCKQEDDVATVVLQVENHCGEHSTEEQVQEIKHLLVKHMEQADCDRDTPVPTSTSSTTTTPTHGTEGILVSGGFGEENEDLKSVELFIPETGQTCSLPDLPVTRVLHTMNMMGDALVVCGGVDEQSSPSKSCVHLSPPSSSVWTSYATTRRERYFHTAWVSPSGELLLVGGADSATTRKERTHHTAWVSPSVELLLVGGLYSYNSAEIVNAGTSTGREIRLEQAAWNHCGIDAKNSVIITGGGAGGRYSERRVARYNLQGHVENLPEMNQGRRYHGCGSYLSDGTMVLIVAGGDLNLGVLSSTERMAIGAAAWTTVNSLPRALYGMASLTVGNLVYLTGGKDEDGEPRSEILVLDGEDWREVGELQIARGNHAATMIETASFMEFCN